jgi:hypothetical protein
MEIPVFLANSPMLYSVLLHLDNTPYEVAASTNLIIIPNVTVGARFFNLIEKTPVVYGNFWTPWSPCTERPRIENLPLQTAW